MVEKSKQELTTTTPHLVQPGSTKVSFANPQTETAYEGLAGIKEGQPPSNEAVLVGIEQAKQSILASQSYLTKEGKDIQQDTLALLDLIKMIIQYRNSDEKIQQFLTCFKRLSDKYAPEFGEDLKFGVQRGYRMSQKGTTRDIYNAIWGLRDFVFQLIRSSDFRQAVFEFFQYIQVLAGQVSIDEKPEGFLSNVKAKLVQGVKAMSGTEEESKEPSTEQRESQVVEGIAGTQGGIKTQQEEMIRPSQVETEEDLRRNQEILSQPTMQQQGVVPQSQYSTVGSSSGVVQQPITQQPEILSQPTMQQQGVVPQSQYGTVGSSSDVNKKRELEDKLIDRFVDISKRFSREPAYQRAIFGLFNLFNQVKGLVQTSTPSNKTAERITEDEDFTALLKYAKLIIYEFSDKKLFDQWLTYTNDFFAHIRTDERLRDSLRDLQNDFRRYIKEPTLLESRQEKQGLRNRLDNFRTIVEEKQNMRLTNDMFRSANDLLKSMQSDGLNTEIRERSVGLISKLFLDEKGNFQLKPSALEQIRTILIVAIQEAISNWNTIEVEGDDGTQYYKISNVVLRANDILPDDIKFKVKNRTIMNYEEVSPVDMMKNSSWITLKLFGMTANLKNVGFMFDRRSFPSISDRGLMDIHLDRGGISMKMKIRASLNQLRPFAVKNVKVAVDTLHIKFIQAEKHKLMLKMMSPIIQNRVRRKIYENLQNAVDLNVRELLERLNDLIENAVRGAQSQTGGAAHVSEVGGIFGLRPTSTTNI